MPNHVTNVLTVVGASEDVKTAIVSLLDENGCVDFNISLPIPKELQGTKSPVTILTQEEYDEQEEKVARGENIFSRGVTKAMEKALIDKYGYSNWYDWQVNTWGTKWNAYEQNTLGEGVYQFQTAWATPNTFFENFSKLFPEVTLQVKYADEDMGYNVGEYHLKNGEYVFTDQPEGGSEEAYRMAISLQGGEDSWLLNDFFDDLEEDDLENAIQGDDSFESIAVRLAYDFEKSNEDYPEVLKQHLLDRAVEEENYIYASKLRDSMKEVEKE